MVIHQEVKLEVHRHASDDPAHDCGRACAQMVIASLVQGVATGMAATAAQQLAPVPVVQDALRRREANQIDVSGNWFTDPDEMLLLLKNAPELQATYPNWRLAVCTDLATVLAEVGLCLEHGMPAVLNIRPSDHWVVVRGVTRDDGVVTLVEMRDPLDQNHKTGANAHTYLDACALDGTTIMDPFTLSSTALGGYQLEIGPTLPNTYWKKYLAVVYGPPPRSRWLKQIVSQTNAYIVHLPRPIVGPGPAAMMGELRRIATALASPRLTALLDPVPHLNIREVHDIDGSDQTFFLASFYDTHSSDGFVAAFRADYRFMHLRFTADPSLVESLTLRPDEELWWTREMLPTLSSPYFPFWKSTVGAFPTYERLIDQWIFKPPPPRAEQS